MKYLVLHAPIKAPHRVGATLLRGDTVYLEIDGFLGNDVLACGSAIDLRDYEGRYEIIDALPSRLTAERVGALETVLRSYNDWENDLITQEQLDRIDSECENILGPETFTAYVEVASRERWDGEQCLRVANDAEQLVKFLDQLDNMDVA